MGASVCKQYYNIILLKIPVTTIFLQQEEKNGKMYLIELKLHIKSKKPQCW